MGALKKDMASSAPPAGTSLEPPCGPSGACASACATSAPAPGASCWLISRALSWLAASSLAPTSGAALLISQLPCVKHEHALGGSLLMARIQMHMCQAEALQSAAVIIAPCSRGASARPHLHQRSLLLLLLLLSSLSSHSLL